ncbi:MAG: sigma-70 family RNA polymerase sigma factor [Myxococcota bacterium]
MPFDPESLNIDQLYARFAPLLLRRIRRFYRGEQAHDVLQEVFLAALEKRHTYRGEAPPRAWLYGIATRHCLARLRNEKRRRELLEEMGEVPWSCPVTSAEGTEARVFLSQLWRTVDPELAQIGVYYYVDQLSQADIGALLGVSGRTISTRLHHLTALAAAAATPGASP